MTEVNETVTIRINEKVSNLTPIHPERCIFRVPHLLRHGNEEFYEPKVISIGPYHRSNPCLASMEEHKIRYLKSLLHKTCTSVDSLVQAIVPYEETVRNYYAESIGYLSSNDLVEMLVLDGCFIINLICRHPINDDSMIDVLIIAWAKDMLLIENQIPFFILQILFNTIYPGLSTDDALKSRILGFFKYRLQFYSYDIKNPGKIFKKDSCRPQEIQNVHHLLDFIHTTICSRFKRNSPTTSSSQIDQMESVNSATKPEVEIGLLNEVSPPQTEREFVVNSATMLKEANVDLISSSEKNSIFDITFRNGYLMIPPLGLDDGSEVEIRNFIALELCQQSNARRLWCDYVIFMDHLVNSSNDVDLLTHCGIFNNNIIDTSSVDNMFRKLTKNIITSDPYTYSEISKDLVVYCKRRRNRWNANLKHNYFNTPWAIISLIAAFVLLCLTFIQTVYAIIN